jgi:hypothetical protein
MYFGPWPALLRLPLHVLAPSWSGFWSRTSCLLASFLALAGFAWLASSALARNSRMGSGHKRALLIVSLLGFGLGSPLAFLSYTGSIYHESIVWAFAASVWGIAFLWRLLDARLLDADSLPLAPLCGLSVAAGVALLSRVTFGAPLLVVLGLVCGDALLRAARAGRIGALLPRLLLPLLPAAAMLAIQLWYNAARFGSPFAFVRYEYLAYLVDDAASWEIFQRTGPFELQRLLSGFANYFGLSASVFSAEFPWIRLAAPAYPDAPLYPQVFSSYLISLWWVSSWLVLGALAGLSSLFGRAGSLLARACAAAFALELLGVAAFLVLEQRYTTDFLPFLLLAYAFFLRHARGSRIALAGLVAAVTLSCVATVLSTLSAIPLSGPGLPAAYKAMWEERFRSVDRWFGPTRHSPPTLEPCCMMGAAPA